MTKNHPLRVILRRMMTMNKLFNIFFWETKLIDIISFVLDSVSAITSLLEILFKGFEYKFFVFHIHIELLKESLRGELISPLLIELRLNRDGSVINRIANPITDIVLREIVNAIL